MKVIFILAAVAAAVACGASTETFHATSLTCCENNNHYCSLRYTDCSSVVEPEGHRALRTERHFDVGGMEGVADLESRQMLTRIEMQAAKIARSVAATPPCYPFELESDGLMFGCRFRSTNTSHVDFECSDHGFYSLCDAQTGDYPTKPNVIAAPLPTVGWVGVGVTKNCTDTVLNTAVRYSTLHGVTIDSQVSTCDTKVRSLTVQSNSVETLWYLWEPAKLSLAGGTQCSPSTGKTTWRCK